MGRAQSPSRQDSGGPEEACGDEEAKGLVGNPVGAALTGWFLAGPVKRMLRMGGQQKLQPRFLVLG